MSEASSVFVGALISTALSFGAGYGLALAVEEYKRKRALRMTAASIIHELADLQKSGYETIKSEKQLAEMKSRFIVGDFTTTFQQITAASLESALYSGVFRDFDTDTQLSIADLESRIRFINLLNLRFIELTTVKDTDPSYGSNVWSFYIMINNQAKKITELIAKLVEKLQPYQN